MLLGINPVEMALLLIAGVALDRLLGEPRRFHPLAGFGALASWVERICNRMPHAGISRLTGIGAWMLAALPATALAAWFTSGGFTQALIWAAHALALYLALGAQSLKEHIAPIADALDQHQLDEARRLAARIVSRDTAALDEAGVARAAIESALENGNDAVFGALFWFALAGAPGVILFRLANTLDAMWGYRNARFRYFGWAAARLDDALNLIPARLTALTYALLGSTTGSRTGSKTGSTKDSSTGSTANALACWRSQAAAWSSPNAGPVMAAGAGALGVALGGPAMYAGSVEQRPPLGGGAAPTAAHIRLALRLVEHGMLAWLLVSIGAAIIWGIAHA